jgi:hypothetical protein
VANPSTTTPSLLTNSFANLKPNNRGICALCPFLLFLRLLRPATRSLKNYYFVFNFHQKNFLPMNLKRIFGAVLTILGIGALIYAAVLFVNSGSLTDNLKSLIIYGALGLLFFISGISLVRTTKDEA